MAATTYWDQQRERISFPETDEYKLYQMKKMLGHAWHKLQAIQTEQKIIDASDSELILLGYNNPELARNLARKRLADGLHINAYADDASDGNYIGTRNKTASFPLEERLATPEALIALYDQLNPQQRIYCGLHYSETLSFLIDLLNEQLEIYTEQGKLRTAYRKAKRKLLHRLLIKTQLTAALKDATPSRTATINRKIAQLEEEIAENQEIMDSAKAASRNQITIKWTGLRPEFEISQAHTRAAELHGNAAADALATAHNIPNAARARARKLLNEYALNKSGQGAEHMAASFPGFPEPEDLMQESLLTLQRTQTIIQGDTPSLDSGLLTKELSDRWKMMKRAASTQKRNLAAAMTGPMALDIATPEAEAWDLITALQIETLPDLLNKCLTDKQRKAFILCEIEGHTLREAASTIGMDFSNLRKTLNSAKKRLQAALTA